MFDNRPEKNTPDYAIVSTKTDQRKRSGGGSTCKDFIIDPKMLNNGTIFSNIYYNQCSKPKII